jgi:hypothetical protein
MKNSTKWTIGIVIGLVVLFALPFIWQLLFPAYSGYGYGMRGYGGGWHMPMMGYGFGFLPFGMFFMWLIPLGTLVFLGLGITWLVKQLTAKKPE